MQDKKKYDVIILGAGIGGTLLGSILARKNKKVLILDAGMHPRFAIGEATTPDTSFRLKLLSLKYDVPEIKNLSTFHKLRDNVSAACGVKRAFSFVYQREGKEQLPIESHQYPTLAAPMGPDCHFFRQDTDSYMMSVAMKYGAEVLQGVKMEDFEINENGVTVKTKNGVEYNAEFLIDGAGFRSPVAEKFNLREDSSQLLTNSRSIFTHMIGVKLFDLVGEPVENYGLKYPLSQSTLHHVFEGGWYWVIPFNNHVDAVNPLCSVGLVLNRDKYPECGKDPETEFYEFTNKFPQMKRQFENAKAARNWISTGRIQYISKSVSGYRYCLLPHAAGFIDPLFSSGLNLTAASTDLIAKQLIESLDSKNFDPEKFKHIDEHFLFNLKLYDQVVGCSFLSFHDFELWDAWYRVWVVALLVGTSLNANQYMKYIETKDPDVLKYSEKEPYTGLLGSKVKECREMYDDCHKVMMQFKDGKINEKDAASKIRHRFKGLSFCPTYWKWDDAKVRSTPAFTVTGMTKMYLWYQFYSPKHIKKMLYDWSPLTAYKYILKEIFSNNNKANTRRKMFVRDVVSSKNKDFNKKYETNY